jgi:hypothetical protein
MKKHKNIGINPKTTKKELQKQAIDRGVSYKQHCEDILEHQGKNNTIDLGKSKPKPKAKPKDDSAKKEEPKPEPVLPENKFNNPPEKEVPKMSTESNPITKDDKKGAFARHSPNIYTNGKIWEHRRMLPEIGLISSYYRKLDEALSAKKSEDPAKK